MIEWVVSVEMNTGETRVFRGPDVLKVLEEATEEFENGLAHGNATSLTLSCEGHVDDLGITQ